MAEDGEGDGDEEVESTTDEEASDARGDPFDDLAEDVADREGDPFETLAGEGGGSEPGDEAAEPGGASSGDSADHEATSERDPTVTGPTDPFADLPGDDSGAPEDRGTGPDTGGTGTDEGVATPDQGVARADEAVAEAGDREGDPFEAAETAFEEMDVGDLDPDQVWEELDEAEARGSVSEVRERTYAEVSKHSYCEGCEWFSGPPDVSCSHEGTEILEFVDMKTVRVVDCPIVAERRQLQEGE